MSSKTRTRVAAQPVPKATNIVALPAESVDAKAVRVLALRRPKPAGYQQVNVTSTSAQAWRALSPFYLGPVTVHTPRGGFESRCVENAWQYTKVYAFDPAGRPMVDEAGAPTDVYYDWARAGWANPRPTRFPMGRGARPLYSLGPAGERLSYIEARRILYAPWYAGAAAATPAYQSLRELYAAQLAGGSRIALVDFDGWDHIGQSCTLAQVLREPRPKMGHAFVLAGMLTGDIFWT